MSQAATHTGERSAETAARCFGPDEDTARSASRELRAAVEASVSIAQVLRHLGCANNGWQRSRVRQRIADERLDTSHFLGRAHARGKPGTRARGPEEVLVPHVGGHRVAAKRLRSALVQVGVPERCAGCGVGTEWLGKPMTLEVDHIDGNWRDNRRENLRLLCPNCHAITASWCRGGRRASHLDQ